ncbi:MAG: hypothetical protein IJ087_01550 [Eggerthellaceae bacterium]|nr:hypothetical protein [Eggerthellaceae bacterium]
MAKPKITTADIRVLLHEKYGDHRKFAYAEEVGNATGLEQKRRLDAVAVNVYKSNNYSIEGIEIKVSRADLRRELQDSSKHNIFFDWIDYYSLVTTEDVLAATRREEIPPKWGIYEVYAGPDGETRAMRTVRKPLSLHDEQAPAIARPFFACLIRALCNQTPSASAVQAAYKEGETAAAKKYEWQLAHSDAARIAELQEELAAFDELRRQLKVWGGAGGIERGIKKYRAITGVNLSYLDRDLKDLIYDIEKIRGQIPAALQAQRGCGQ